MADLKQQLEELINSLPVEDGVKQTLLTKLNVEGASEDMVIEVRVVLAEAQVNLNKKYKPQLDQLKALEQEEKAAYDTYSQEMDELEEDLDNLAKALTKAEEEQQLEEARKKIV
ncbi:MAG: hypothetical protein AAB410_00195 [Patescibacteria group bacterium]